jgi:hypothetical protein
MGTARTATVVVDADIECWCLPHAAIESLRNEEPAVQATLLSNLLGIIAVDAHTIERALRALAA